MARDFDDWHQICKKEKDRIRESNLLQIALKKIEDLVADFKQWLKVYIVAKSLSNTSLHQKVLKRLIDLAQSFDNWITIYNLAKDSNLQQVALEKLREFYLHS